MAYLLSHSLIPYCVPLYYFRRKSSFLASIFTVIKQYAIVISSTKDVKLNLGETIECDKGCGEMFT